MFQCASRFACDDAAVDKCFFMDGRGGGLWQDCGNRYPKYIGKTPKRNWSSEGPGSHGWTVGISDLMKCHLSLLYSAIVKFLTISFRTLLSAAF